MKRIQLFIANCARLRNGQGLQIAKLGFGIWLLFGIWDLGFGILLSAEPTKESADIKEIIVTATRSEKESIKVPNNITVITESDIKRSGAQTIPDILRTEAGLVVRDWSGSGKFVSIDIRGFGGTGELNTLVLVDGRRVNSIDLSATDWLQVPLAAVSRIEVIRGHGSVLYGDNAAGGVVNIITKKGAVESQRHPALMRENTTYDIKQSAGSYNTSIFSLDARGGGDDLTFSISQNNRNTDGYRQNSYLISQDSNIGLGLKFSPDLNLDFTLGMHDDKYGLPGYLTPAQVSTLGRKATVNPDDNGSTTDYYYQLHLNSVLNDEGKLTVDVSSRQRTSSFLYGGWAGEIRIDSAHFSPRYTFTADPYKIITGLDVFRDKANLYGDDNDKESVGLYALGEASIDKFNLTGGWRFDKVEYVFDAAFLPAVTQSHRRNTVQAGGAYLYQKDSSVYLNLSQSYRFPAVDEYFSAWSGLNTNLKPQSGYQTEAGVKHTFTKSLYGSLSAFRMNINNEIYYNPYSGPFGANENYERTRHQGIETACRYTISKELKAGMNYTYTQAEFVGGMFDGNTVPGVPNRKGSLLLAYTPIGGLEAGLQSNYVGSRYRISDQPNALAPQSGYSTADV
ncbi:MAG: TonB-dependent receptor, partial [Planctomycetes bacterium]|nr:TonB-dependent receptor [Planctomycetota bacterium]